MSYDAQAHPVPGACDCICDSYCESNGSGESPLELLCSKIPRGGFQHSGSYPLRCFNIVLGRSRGRVINMKSSGQSTRGKSRTYTGGCGLHALHFSM